MGNISNSNKKVENKKKLKEEDKKEEENGEKNDSEKPTIYLKNDKNGRNILHLACLSMNKNPCIPTLIEIGFSLLTKDNFDKYPFEYCTDEKIMACLQWLSMYEIYQLELNMIHVENKNEIRSRFKSVDNSFLKLDTYYCIREMNLHVLEKLKEVINSG